MTSSSLHIRPAVAADAPLIHALVRELAEYEREPASARLSEADLLRDGFGETPSYTCLIAEDAGPGGRMGCGFALFFPIYSTWAGRSLYLEDLFVRPAYRGRGVGKTLLAHVASIAERTGCARLDWSVLRWNEPALDFYEGLGAVRLSEWDRMRLSGEALTRVSGSIVSGPPPAAAGESPEGTGTVAGMRSEMVAVEIGESEAKA